MIRISAFEKGRDDTKPAVMRRKVLESNHLDDDISWVESPLKVEVSDEGEGTGMSFVDDGSQTRNKIISRSAKLGYFIVY